VRHGTFFQSSISFQAASKVFPPPQPPPGGMCRQDSSLLIPSDDAIQQAEATSEELQAAIEDKERSLREQGHGYLMDGQFCRSCWIRLTGNAKRCHRCNNSEFHPEFCTQESRIAYYFAAIRQAGLWPLSQTLSKSSVNMLSSCLSEIPGALRHTCIAGSHCPLMQGVDGLLQLTSRILGEVRGLCLDCLRKDQFSALMKSPGEWNCRVRHLT
jgi:ribosomal protein L40E